MNLTFQRQVLLEPLLAYLRDLLNGGQPNGRSAAALPSELRALLSELAGRSAESQRATGRAGATLASLSGECREAGQTLSVIGQAQQEESRLAQGSLHELQRLHQSTENQAQHLTMVIDAVSSSIVELGSAIGRVGQSVAAFQQSIDESSSQVTELASALKEVGGHAGDLCAKWPDVGATAVELGAGARAVMEQVQLAAQIAGAMQEKAQVHAGQIDLLLHGHMREIQQTADESLAAIGDLRVQSDAIGKIVTVIEGITKQTNLLALNAAILAAQSGSEGKSFSVVADEIRVLADRTARSAKEIAGVVCSVQAGADRAAEVVHRFQAHFDEGSKRSLEATQLFTELVQQSQRAADVMGGIGRAIGEQHRGIDLLSQSIEQMAQMLQSVQRVSAQHHQVAERAIDLAERTRRTAKQIHLAGDGQLTASRQIIESVEPLAEQGRMLVRVLGEYAAHVTPLQSQVQHAAEQAARLTALSGSLRQTGATLQAIAAQWGASRTTS